MVTRTNFKQPLSTAPLMPTHITRGYIPALFAACCWGAAGTFAQFLFQHKAMTAEWLVTARLLSAGILLVGWGLMTHPRETLSIFRNRIDCLRLLSFSLFGMWMVQYTYFAAISASNAATATIIQYIGPVLIAIWYALIERRFPRPLELLAISLAMAGVFFLVTHGDPSGLSISPAALFWGLMSAVAMATSTIQPISLMKHYSTPTIIGWGMVIGGAAFSLISHPWHIVGQWDGETLGAFAFIVIFGTLLSFSAYLAATRLIGARSVSLAACAEPLAATVIAVIWLSTPFGPYDVLGGLLILSTIVILTFRDPSRPATP